MNSVTTVSLVPANPTVRKVLLLHLAFPSRPFTPLPHHSITSFTSLSFSYFILSSSFFLSLLFSSLSFPLLYILFLALSFLSFSSFRFPFLPLLYTFFLVLFFPLISFLSLVFPSLPFPFLQARPSMTLYIKPLLLCSCMTSTST